MYIYIYTYTSTCDVHGARSWRAWRLLAHNVRSFITFGGELPWGDSWVSMTHPQEIRAWRPDHALEGVPKYECIYRIRNTILFLEYIYIYLYKQNETTLYIYIYMWIHNSTPIHTYIYIYVCIYVYTYL